MPSSLRIDPADFREVIELAVRTALREFQASRGEDDLKPLALPKPKAAKVLGVSTSTVERLIGKGELHPIRTAGRTLLARSELVRWVQAKTAAIDDTPCDESHSPENGEWVESQSPTQSPVNGEREGEREDEQTEP